MKKTLKNELGITLIALVITVVVMLILAGVTINLTLGENGIFTTAQQAVKNYTEAQEKEQEDLAYFTNTVDNIAKGNTTLTSQITGADYGKYINYSVTVEDTVLDKWRVFYNDKNNVYIILDGYLPNKLISEQIGNEKVGSYVILWSADKFSTNEEVVAKLKNTTYWSAFAGGVTGAIAYGGPTNEMFVNSWNNNPKVNSTKLNVSNEASELIDTSKLYIIYPNDAAISNGYWLSTEDIVNDKKIWSIYRNDYATTSAFINNGVCIRPVVCLPFEITGTVSSSINIDY